MSTLARHVPGTPSWFDLMTSDRAGAVAFYEGLFGWTITNSGPEYGNYGMCQLGEHNAAGLGEIPPGAGFPPAWSVYFGVESADATAQAIVAAGGSVVMGPIDIPGAGRMLMAADPTGAVFGVWEPRGHMGAGVVYEPGAMAWCEVNTRDAAAAATFYTKVFGLEAEPLGADAFTYFSLHKGERVVGGVLQMTEQWGDMAPHWMAYFQVADAVASAARVTALGGTVAHGPFDTTNGRIAVIRDPQGAVFSIVQARVD